MAYQFDFIPVLQNADLLLRGALFTLELTAIGTLLGVSVGIVGAIVRAWKIQPFSAIFGVYVELIRNTPFLVQLFFIFFGLPSLGLQISEWQAAVLAMVINLGAYSTEIIRAGIQAISRGQLEASAALAMTRFETFRHVVLVPALGKVWPALSSQIIIVMLGSAVCSQIATDSPRATKRAKYCSIACTGTPAIGIGSPFEVPRLVSVRFSILAVRTASSKNIS